MKFSLVLLTSLVFSAVAEDLLFNAKMQWHEYEQAVEMNYTVKVVDDTEWANMSTADFAKYKAIVIADTASDSVDYYLDFFNDTKGVWGPAVQGNIIVIGTDPSNHFGQSGSDARTLIRNAIGFAAAGTTPEGVHQTGLYFALAHYYDSVENATIDSLSYFGPFAARGNLACYDESHIVATSPAMTSLNDTVLSNWGCSVHETIAEYLSTGPGAFQALAIAQDVTGFGSRTFGDNTTGIPYVIARGATPAKCGDGMYDSELGEECDDGNQINGDGCSLGCKCEVGWVANGDGSCRHEGGYGGYC